MPNLSPIIRVLEGSIPFALMTTSAIGRKGLPQMASGGRQAAVSTHLTIEPVPKKNGSFNTFNNKPVPDQHGSFNTFNHKISISTNTIPNIKQYDNT